MGYLSYQRKVQDFWTINSSVARIWLHGQIAFVLGVFFCIWGYFAWQGPMTSTTDIMPRMVNHLILEIRPTSHCLILVCTGGFQFDTHVFQTLKCHRSQTVETNMSRAQDCQIHPNLHKHRDDIAMEFRCQWQECWSCGTRSRRLQPT